MREYLLVLALAAMPALGNFAGGLLAEMVAVSQRALSLALHGAAGIVIAVVAVELMPTALKTDVPWVIIVAFMLGGGFFVLVDQMIEIVKNRMGRAASDTTPWAIFFGVSVDLFSDGIMIGSGSTISFSLGLLLALGHVPADVPEGFATIATFKRQGLSRSTRILLGASFAIPIFLGTTIGYWAVRGQPEIIKLSLLAFTAGILTTVVVEEMVPEAHRDGESRLAALIFVSGFALFTLLSTYLG